MQSRKEATSEILAERSNVTDIGVFREKKQAEKEGSLKEGILKAMLEHAKKLGW